MARFVPPPPLGGGESAPKARSSSEVRDLIVIFVFSGTYAVVPFLFRIFLLNMCMSLLPRAIY